MGYWTEQDLPFYSSLAKQFPVADRWHVVAPGPTFPNRRFLIAGTANGLIDDVIEGMFDLPRGRDPIDLLDRKVSAGPTTTTSRVGRSWSSAYWVPPAFAGLAACAPCWGGSLPGSVPSAPTTFSSLPTSTRREPCAV